MIWEYFKSGTFSISSSSLCRMRVRTFWGHKSSKAIITRQEGHTTQRTNQRKTTNHNEQHTKQPNATQDDKPQRTTHKATKRNTNQCNAQINVRRQITTYITQSNQTQCKTPNHTTLKSKGSAAVAVACKSGHRALVAREGPLAKRFLRPPAKLVPLSPNPLPPGTPPLQPTLWFCIHRHNCQCYSQLLLLLLNTNTSKTVHVKCEQAHDNRDHIWASRNRW